MSKTFRILKIIILLWCAQIAHAQTPFNYSNDFKKTLSRTKDQSDELFYDKLLQRFHVNDPTLTPFHVLSMLIAFTDKPAYRPYKDLETEKRIYRLNADGKVRQSLDSASAFLKTHPLSVKVLFEKANAFHKLGLKDSAAYYTVKGRGIFEAMNFSGNGQTPDTPIFALGPADGQDFIYKYVAPKIGGAKIGTMGSGQDKNQNFLDVLEVVPRNKSKPYSLYFIIQHAKD